MVTLHIQIYKMTITDTHTIYIQRDQDRGEMIQRAIDAGVLVFLFLQSTLRAAMYDLEKKLSGRFFLMMGLHPTYVRRII
jgi:TatD DNase family protein